MISNKLTIVKEEWISWTKEAKQVEVPEIHVGTADVYKGIYQGLYVAQKLKKLNGIDTIDNQTQKVFYCNKQDT